MPHVSVSDVEGEVDYDAVMKEFGIEPLQIEKMPAKKLPLLYRRGYVIGQRDFSAVLNAIKSRKKFAVVTGINPSGPLHIGHMMFLLQAKFFQELGADVYIPISNDETYVFRKSQSVEQATRNAEEIMKDIVAMGFDPKKTKIFISTKTQAVYELAVQLSAKTTFSTIKAIFGFDNETNPGAIFYGVVQSAHILLPQALCGNMPTVVPIGIDQDPYMRLSRDLAEKCGFIKPSSTNHKFIPGLQGGKMSSSKPETCIFLTDKPEDAKRKIMRAFSGGAASLEEHRKHGGNPDIDIACQYMHAFFETDDKKIAELFAGYRSGAVTSGDVKSLLAERVSRFLKEHQRKREAAKKRIGKFMLDNRK